MVKLIKTAKVMSVQKAQRVRSRPFPLNTVEALKLISRKLRISPEQAMKHMERLYNLGYLSYPRTETTRYNKTINLFQIVNWKESLLWSNKTLTVYAVCTFPSAQPLANINQNSAIRQALTAGVWIQQQERKLRGQQKGFLSRRSPATSLMEVR